LSPTSFVSQKARAPTPKGLTRKELSERFRRYFKIPSALVGVTVSLEDAPPVGGPARYCGLVRRVALYGESYTITADNLTCANAEAALGFSASDEGDDAPRLPAGTRAVHLEPLDAIQRMPDVVLVISNPRKLMGVATLLSQVLGAPVEFSARGDVAVCGEATAVPLLEKRANLSLLCNGARIFSGYRDDEMVLGIPYPMFREFTSLVSEERVAEAMCGCIMDDLPGQVIGALLSMGFTKGTDHFVGRFEGEIVRLYTPKNPRGRIDSLSLHLPLNLGSAEAARRAETAADWPDGAPLAAAAREAWLDVTLRLDLNEPLNCAVARGETFRALVMEGIRSLLDVARGLAKAERRQPPRAPDGKKVDESVEIV